MSNLVEGVVTGIVRDAETGAFKRSFRQSNHVSNWMLDEMTTGEGSEQFGRYIYVTDYTYETDQRLTTVFSTYPNGGAVGFTESGVTNPVGGGGTYDPQVPYFLQFQQRFNPPVGSSRTIRCVGLSGDTAVTAGMWVSPSQAMVRLSQDCLQSTTETLDVFYRIQFPWEYDLSNPPTQTDYGWAMWQSYLIYRNSFDNWDDQWPTNGSGVGWNGNLDLRTLGNSYGSTVYMLYDTPPVGGNFSFSADTAYSKNILRNTADIADGTGSLIGYFSYGQLSGWKRFHTLAVEVGTNPIQNLFGHGPSATKPFFDASAQPAGDATVAFGEGTWNDDPRFPKMYRVQMTTSGAIGVADYQLWERSHFAFQLNTWQNAPRALQSTYYSVNDDLCYDAFRMAKDDTGSFDSLAPRFIRYGNSFDTMVAIRQTEICVANLSIEAGTRFNATNYPSFTPTDITDIAIDSSGDIYVACRASGLYKISDPTGSPTITVIDDTTTGLTGAAGPQVYGVAAGRNDKIWIMMDGGLFYSDDDGATWTAATFSFTGISDSNWSWVRQIEADIEHADDRIGITYRTASNSRVYVCWYDLASTTTVAGQDVSGSFSLADNLNGNYYWDIDIFYTTIQMLAVSKSQGKWGTTCYRTSSTSTLGRPAYFTFGTTTRLDSTVDTTWTWAHNFFDTDDDGNQSLMGQGDDPTFGDWCTWVYKDTDVRTVQRYATSNGNWDGNYSDHHQPSGCYLGQGVFVNYVSPTTMAIATCAPYLTDAAEAGQFENVIWRKYGWDGGAWVEGDSGSKLTHNTEDAAIDGLTIQFDDDSGSETYTLDDYYTVCVLNGIQLDGSTEYDHSAFIYFKPIQDQTELEISVIPSTTRIPFSRLSSYNVMTWQDILTYTTTTIAAYQSSNRTTPDYSRGARSVNTCGGALSDMPYPISTPDSEVVHCYLYTEINAQSGSWDGTSAGQLIFGLSDVSVAGNAHTYAGIQFGMHIDGRYDTANDAAEISIVEGGVTKYTSPFIIDAYQARDGSGNWKMYIYIMRDGSIQYWGGDCLLYTSPAATANPALSYLLDIASHGDSSNGLSSCRIYTPLPAGRYFEFGKSGSPSTGRYIDDFNTIDIDRSIILIDGVEATLIAGSSVPYAPAAGEVVVFNTRGEFLVSDSDVGKTISAEYIVQTAE